MKIREQIKAGVFPVRLAAEDWTSGEITWLIDIIAPSRTLATNVLTQLGQVTKGGELRLHPAVKELVDAEALMKMGAQKNG